MEPDGYNFVVSGIATHAIAPVINPNTGYDPVNDFTHVAYFGGPPIVFIVPTKLGVKTLAEFVTYARSRKEPLTFASPGTGTSGHLVAEYFAQKAGIKIEHIPYRGAAPGVMDVMAGQLTFGSMTWTTASGQISAGTVVPLATSAPQRLADFPTIPTFKEEGYPDLVEHDLVCTRRSGAAAQGHCHEAQSGGRESVRQARGAGAAQGGADHHRADEPGRADPVCGRGIRPLAAGRGASQPAQDKLTVAEFAAARTIICHAGRPARRRGSGTATARASANGPEMPALAIPTTTFT